MKERPPKPPGEGDIPQRVKDAILRGDTNAHHAMSSAGGKATARIRKEAMAREEHIRAVAHEDIVAELMQQPPDPEANSPQPFSREDAETMARELVRINYTGFSKSALGAFKRTRKKK